MVLIFSTFFSTVFATSSPNLQNTSKLPSTFRWSGISWSKLIANDPSDRSMAIKGRELFGSEASSNGVFAQFGIVSVDSYSFASTRTITISMNPMSGAGDRVKLWFMIAPNRATSANPIDIPNFFAVLMNSDFHYGSWYAQIIDNINNPSPGGWTNTLFSARYSGHNPVTWKIILTGQSVRVLFDGLSVYSSKSLGLAFSGGYMYFYQETPVTGGPYYFSSNHFLVSPAS